MAKTSGAIPLNRDTLYKISSQFYGDSNQYTKIFNANRNVLRDLNTIDPGQELVIPE